MSRKTTYVIRYTTPMGMGELVTALEKTGHVDTIQIKDKAVAPISRINLTAEERSARAKKRDADHPDLVEQRKKILADAVAAFRIKVRDSLIPILIANQHAPMETLVREMNKTDVKNYRGEAWNNTSLNRHVEYALQHLTNPGSEG